jgi:hypothetical protein
MKSPILTNAMVLNLIYVFPYAAGGDNVRHLIH